MIVTSDKDFTQLRRQLQNWRKKFSMFKHDVDQIEQSVEKHIQNYAIAGVHYRQTKQKQYLERAQHELDEINRIIQLAEKMELMSLLSCG
jgi:pyridoxine 5'-phosphate synthase PdxJ